MALYLIRHAKAGDRHRWTGPDDVRPLSKKGWRQAEGLRAAFEGRDIPRLLSSPYVRCMQTLEPMAEMIGGKVEPAPVLAEGMSFDGALDLLQTLPDGSVLCSHGDVIPDTIDALIRRGTALVGTPDWRKAVTWVLERDARGAITTATAVPPPADE
jgi:8-oxo-dGTP diphosphatase